MYVVQGHQEYKVLYNYDLHAAALCVTDLEPYEFRVVALCVTELPVVIVHGQVCKLPDVITLHWVPSTTCARCSTNVRQCNTGGDEGFWVIGCKDDFSSPGLKVSAENFAKRLEGYTISGVQGVHAQQLLAQKKKLAAFIKSKPRRQKVLLLTHY
ncbi:hypothetical protein BDP27DRAFT_1407490 [Rhodocollybia butyracea]|uniref:Uncharacterized protein n=1 Tax=Rhodocollybia butyracea TaxID=206335 RepID=A0A9P5PBB6_9AGAR|nr:hypothetical protein BDP27DRAFT_1407490 [Rhodocollybia butyracea]